MEKTTKAELVAAVQSANATVEQKKVTLQQVIDSAQAEYKQAQVAEQSAKKMLAIWNLIYFACSSSSVIEERMEGDTLIVNITEMACPCGFGVLVLDELEQSLKMRGARKLVIEAQTRKSHLFVRPLSSDRLTSCKPEDYVVWGNASKHSDPYEWWILNACKNGGHRYDTIHNHQDCNDVYVVEGLLEWRFRAE